MSLFTEERLRSRFRSSTTTGYYETYESKAKTLLSESLNQQTRTFSTTNKNYDIFLSHSSNDAELVLGLKFTIEDLGLSVYVDWIEDPKLNRAEVNRDTAITLKERMKSCSSLIYAFSENATNSKWMPWELGYFDGIKGTVAVLPISKSSRSDFKGSEYLGIYYYIQVDTISGSGRTALWVFEKSNKYVIFNDWLKGVKPIQR